VTKSKSKSAVNESLVVVDAGGTKTAAWLVDLGRSGAQSVLGRGRASAGNPLSVGFEESTRAIADAVSRAQDDASRNTGPVSRAILSIAGSANIQLREQFIAWAHDVKLAERIAIVSDVLPVLAAGTPNCCGVALISGTGSVAFARGEDGRMVRCGGWGYLLGDEGSGFAIGRAALQDALHALESLSALQPLADATRKAMGANSVTELTKTIYEDPDPRGAIASVAPIVIAAADEGDAFAQSILDKAADELAKIVARAARIVVSTDRPFSLAVSGGVLVGSKRIRERLHAQLTSVGLACNINVVEEPLEGCVRLAAPELSGTLINWHGGS
jgi:N-acetylglucosamine kinase-like BadF-type ATPase